MTGDILTGDNLAGVIVLYNPDSNTIANVSSYIKHLSHLYVIDNSESADAELIAGIIKISPKISYHPFGENKGIAKALNEGCTLALNDSFKWILTMDQDSWFEDGSFFESVLNNAYADVAVIAASYNTIHFQPQTSPYPGLLDVGFVITSGNILNINAWQLCGGFIDKMFIDEVDNEFCIRAKNKGFKILATSQVYLKHKLGDGFAAKHFLTGKQVVLTKHSPLRVYYTVRNNFYMWPRYLFSNFMFVANRMRNTLTLVFKILVYFPDKKSYLKHIGRAMAHAAKGRYGKFSN